jgi:hypothetical protein
MFEGECVFGRYNHCISTKQREFPIARLFAQLILTFLTLI